MSVFPLIQYAIQILRGELQERGWRIGGERRDRREVCNGRTGEKRGGGKGGIEGVGVEERFAMEIIWRSTQ